MKILELIFRRQSEDRIELSAEREDVSSMSAASLSIDFREPMALAPCPVHNPGQFTGVIARHPH